VSENHEARIINDVVDTMDLSPLLAKYEGGSGTSLSTGHDVEDNHLRL
jgi:transposase